MLIPLKYIFFCKIGHILSCAITKNNDKVPNNCMHYSTVYTPAGYSHKLYSSDAQENIYLNETIVLIQNQNVIMGMSQSKQ